MIRCDRCNGETREKRVPFKDKSRGTFLKYECVSGCMEGKWPYARFAPRGMGQAQTPQSPAPVVRDAGNEVLRLILKEIEAIRKTLEGKCGIDQEEDQVPF